MKFKLEKASNWSFNSEVNLKSMEDILEFINKNGDIIINKFENPKDYEYGILIYDGYIE